jgi:hypothetical protein
LLAAGDGDFGGEEGVFGVGVRFWRPARAFCFRMGEVEAPRATLLGLAVVDGFGAILNRFNDGGDGNRGYCGGGDESSLRLIDGDGEGEKFEETNERGDESLISLVVSRKVVG